MYRFYEFEGFKSVKIFAFRLAEIDEFVQEA